MSIRNTGQQWGSLAKTFHWLMAALIVAAWVAFEIHDGEPKGSPERGQWLDYHKALGLTVFFLVWLRLAWRLSNAAPVALAVSAWQEWAATAAHWGLYLLMVGMPLTGILMSEYGDHPVSWFGVFTLPALVSPDKAMGRIFHELHTDVFWPILLGVAGLHIVAALWHHFIVKDDTLRRMLPGKK